MSHTRETETEIKLSVPLVFLLLGVSLSSIRCKKLSELL